MLTLIMYQKGISLRCCLQDLWDYVYLEGIFCFDKIEDFLTYLPFLPSPSLFGNRRAEVCDIVAALRKIYIEKGLCPIIGTLRTLGIVEDVTKETPTGFRRSRSTSYALSSTACANSDACDEHQSNKQSFLRSPIHCRTHSTGSVTDESETAECLSKSPRKSPQEFLRARSKSTGLMLENVADKLATLTTKDSIGFAQEAGEKTKRALTAVVSLPITAAAHLPNTLHYRRKSPVSDNSPLVCDEPRDAKDPVSERSDCPP